MAPDLDPAEHPSRLRSLRAVVRGYVGPRGAQLADLLRQAERDPAALEPALDVLDELAPLDRRRVLASYANLDRPAAQDQLPQGLSPVPLASAPDPQPPPPPRPR